ncbi:MAG: hypothetical protein ACOX6Y_12385 [Christensenellales bacterium]
MALKDGFIVKNTPVILVVHPPDNAVADAPGDHRFALGMVQPVHPGDHIVHIAGVIADAAKQQIRQQIRGGSARLGADHAQGFAETPGVHPQEALQEKTDLAHITH